LLQRYHKIPRGLQEGFSFSYAPITSTQIPPNKDSVIDFTEVFQETVAAEIRKGRYIGLLSQEEVEIIIGPFQTSPFSVIPKPGKPGKFRLIQNLSFPCVTSRLYPNPSINSGVNPDNFPCTWDTFDTICLLISRLPPESQTAVRDVSEAYRTIPLHCSQWPSTVARIGEDKFCLDLNACFGVAPAAGGYGHMGDAGADLFRANGRCPVSKWVADHVFFRILHAYQDDYMTITLNDRRGTRIYVSMVLHKVEVTFGSVVICSRMAHLSNLTKIATFLALISLHLPSDLQKTGISRTPWQISTAY